eukprot:g6384.t1
MVAAQNKQLVVQGDEQREVQQRLLEVRKEALEGLAQAFSLQEGGLPMTPPDQHRAVSGSEIRSGTRIKRVERRSARRGGAAGAQVAHRPFAHPLKGPEPRKASPESADESKRAADKNGPQKAPGAA